MPLTKGQRVEVKVRDGVQFAHVHKVAAAGISLILDTWAVTKPVSERFVSPSAAPVPEGAPGHRKWAKGDRIEFDTDGRTVHATVISGDLLSVKAMGDGGEYEYGVPTRDIRPSGKVLPKPAPSVMDDWGVRSYKPNKGLSDETEAFTADVTYKGKTVLKARNAGHGGCHDYQGPRADMERLERDAKAWLEEANVEHLSEASDHWLTWHATLRPYAVDAMDHLRKFDAEFAQHIYMPASP